MRLLWLPDHLHEWGLEPIEFDGWRDRGYGDFDTFRPRGFVDHHTAGAPSGWAPSLGTVARGRADVPGPLSQLFTPRNPQGKHNVHVVAAGRANHAGAGGWAGLVGNSSVVGHERENVGTAAEPWQPWQTEDAVLVAACVLDGLRRYENVDAQPGHYSEHKEWAPARKSDAHTISGSSMRAAIGVAIPRGSAELPAPTTQEDNDEMFYVINYGGGAGRWAYFPQTNTKVLITSGAALAEIEKAKGYGGRVEMAEDDLRAIPYPNPAKSPAA